MRAKGFSLVEAVITTAVISVALAGSTYIFSVGIKAVSGNKIKFQSRLLAKDLMEEILSKEHWKKDGDCSLGAVFPRPEQGESRWGQTPESAFDDVDDYNYHTDAPPRTIDNVAMDGVAGRPDFRNFNRQASVEYLDPLTLGPPNPHAITNYKSISVAVRYSAKTDFQNPDFIYILRRIVAAQR